MYSRTIQESTIFEKEPFPDEMLKPFSENMPLSVDGILNLMIAYYNDTYENLKFQKLFKTNSLNSIIIPLRINKYSKFASENDSIDIYPGQIQFFFVHEISTNRINMENHYLTYVLKYKILDRKNAKEYLTEPFPDEMLKPFSENMPLSVDGILNLMIAYYNDTYENLKFQKLFKTNSLNSIIIPLRINKYCRC
ncbi:hypothetical protein Glove_243g88 [Diversispora epigaea]|uniref:Uncharacterized protein n=1 Tax=Diversispora epigaea TaxID=1348612 RepID=A0A397I9J6_9GLOM|nr:hypothetical protein Glove_243g88 [Diversispora epigaea]